MSRICVLGASGRTGRLVVRAAIARGHGVTAFCRSAESAAGLPDGADIVIGDVLSREDVGRAVDGADVVTCLLGPRRPGADCPCAAATAIVLEAMAERGVERIICITGALVGEFPTTRSAPVRARMELFRRRYPEAAADRERQEQLVADSPTRWIIVKPPRLTDRPPRRIYRMGEGLAIGLRSRIARADLATFILDQVDAPIFERRRVVVQY